MERARTLHCTHTAHGGRSAAAAAWPNLSIYRGTNKPTESRQDGWVGRVFTVAALRTRGHRAAPRDGTRTRKKERASERHTRALRTTLSFGVYMRACGRAAMLRFYS